MRTVLVQSTITVVGIVFTGVASPNFHIARITTDMLALFHHFWFVGIVIVVSVRRNDSISSRARMEFEWDGRTEFPIGCLSNHFAYDVMRSTPFYCSHRTMFHALRSHPTKFRWHTATTGSQEHLSRRKLCEKKSKIIISLWSLFSNAYVCRG